MREGQSSTTAFLTCGVERLDWQRQKAKVEMGKKRYKNWESKMEEPRTSQIEIWKVKDRKNTYSFAKSTQVVFRQNPTNSPSCYWMWFTATKKLNLDYLKITRIRNWM